MKHSTGRFRFGLAQIVSLSLSEALFPGHILSARQQVVLLSGLSLYFFSGE